MGKADAHHTRQSRRRMRHRAQRRDLLCTCDACYPVTVDRQEARGQLIERDHTDERAEGES